MAQPKGQIGVARRRGGRLVALLLILCVVGAAGLIYGWSSVNQRFETLWLRVDELAGADAGEVDGRIGSLGSAVAALREGVDGLHEDLLGVREEVGALRGEFVARTEEVNALRGDLLAQADAVNELRTGVSESREAIADVRSQSIARAESVEAHIVALDERIVALADLVEFAEAALDGLATPAVAPSAAPSSTPAPTLRAVGDEVIVYRVRPGETLWEISISLTGSALNYPVLMEYNGLPSPPQLRAGQTLLVPVTILANKE